jgi:hypothetical protein
MVHIAENIVGRVISERDVTRFISETRRSIVESRTLNQRWIKRHLRRQNTYYKFLKSRGYDVDAARNCMYKISDSTRINVSLKNWTVAVFIYPVLGGSPVLDLAQYVEGMFLLETFRECARKYNAQGIYYYNHGVTRQLSIQEKP